MIHAGEELDGERYISKNAPTQVSCPSCASLKSVGEMGQSVPLAPNDTTIDTSVSHAGNMEGDFAIRYAANDALA